LDEHAEQLEVLFRQVQLEKQLFKGKTPEGDDAGL